MQPYKMSVDQQVLRINSHRMRPNTACYGCDFSLADQTEAGRTLIIRGRCTQVSTANLEMKMPIMKMPSRPRSAPGRANGMGRGWVGGKLGGWR